MFVIEDSNAHQCWERKNNNNSNAVKLHIRMISEGSCDTEDWSNDAENSALPS